MQHQFTESPILLMRVGRKIPMHVENIDIKILKCLLKPVFKSYFYKFLIDALSLAFMFSGSIMHPLMLCTGWGRQHQQYRGNNHMVNTKSAVTVIKRSQGVWVCTSTPNIWRERGSEELRLEEERRESETSQHHMRTRLLSPFQHATLPAGDRSVGNSISSCNPP